MPETRVIDIPYAQDSAQRMMRLAQDPWCVLLDSCHPRAQNGRYDILAADPYICLITGGGTGGGITEIRTRTQTIQSTDDPFALVRHYLGDRLDHIPGIPFRGGALGYFGYDLGRRIERLPDQTIADIGMPDMAIGIYDWVVIVDHHTRQAKLVINGRDEHCHKAWEPLLKISHCESPAAFSTSFQVLSCVAPEIDKSYYARAFTKVKDYIRAGDCYQVNLTQRFSACARGDPWDAYLRLRMLNPAPFSAFFRLPEGAVLSSSPERFIAVRGREVETRPVKGTRARGQDEASDQALAEELGESAKDRAENVMIVDLLRNDLGKTCVTGSVAVPTLFAIESFKTVHHLVSTVTGRLATESHSLDLLRGCFPGGSITGAPKLRAMEIIEELESHRRGIYCGSIGYIGFDGDMDSNIAIRTLVYNADHLYCWAGGGIVSDSVMEDEYQESLDKAAAMIELFVRAEAQYVGS